MKNSTTHNQHVQKTQKITSNIVQVLEALDDRITRTNCKLIDFFPEFLKSNENGNEVFIKSNVFSHAIIQLGLGVSHKQVDSLAQYLVSRTHTLIVDEGHGQISFKQIQNVLALFRKRKENGQLHLFAGKLGPQDPVFPNWITERNDFQSFFPRFSEDIVRDERASLMKALETAKYNRLPSDTVRISQYIINCPAFTTMIKGGVRSIDIAKQLHFMELEADEYLFHQGEEGDSFYIVFSGKVAIEVNGIQVAIFKEHQSFGEKSLENSAPRAASVRAIENCSFVFLSSQDYLNVMSTMRFEKIHKVARLLGSSWEIGKDWLHAKLYTVASLSHELVFEKDQVIFEKGEPSGVFLIVASGRCAVRRLISKTDINRWPSSTKKRTFRTDMHCQRIAIQLRILARGDHFGEDCIFGFINRQYQAIALDHRTKVFAINKEDIQKILSADELQRIKNENQLDYASDEVLIQQYENISERQKYITSLTMQSFGPHYLERKLGASKSAPSLSNKEDKTKVIDLFSHVKSIRTFINDENEKILPRGSTVSTFENENTSYRDAKNKKREGLCLPPVFSHSTSSLVFQLNPLQHTSPTPSIKTLLSGERPHSTES